MEKQIKIPKYKEYKENFSHEARDTMLLYLFVIGYVFGIIEENGNMPQWLKLILFFVGVGWFFISGVLMFPFFVVIHMYNKI